MQLSITATDSGGTRVLAVCGEVDVSSADELLQALDEALSAGVTAVEADLSQVPYIDSTGIGVLVGAARRAEEAGVSFAVSEPQSNVARVLDLLGVSEELRVRRDQS